ncbi:MAG: c-type cytochrome biogenesis protein CcmI, partial [Candidatus Devosia euplotis]|nr:c-type cytochrome biogenesis protein CcmI [Candidatus Devosia euplotis]
MIFCFIAIAVTAIACAALLFAAGLRTVNVAAPQLADSDQHFGLVLAGIDADRAVGKLDQTDALAARAELAREILRAKADAQQTDPARKELGRGPLLAGLAGVAVLALSIYGLLGSPDLPSQPLASRPQATAPALDLEQAVARVEAALADNPDDLRGWTVVAPIYMQTGRFVDAARAYRRIIALSGP